MRRRPAVLFLAAAALAAAAGCSPNPPCKVDPSDVDAARAHAKAEEVRLDVLTADRDRITEELEALEARRMELETKKAELEAQAEELRRRSGRGGAK